MRHLNSPKRKSSLNISVAIFAAILTFYTVNAGLCYYCVKCDPTDNGVRMNCGEDTNKCVSTTFNGTTTRACDVSEHVDGLPDLGCLKVPGAEICVCLGVLTCHGSNYPITMYLCNVWNGATVAPATTTSTSSAYRHHPLHLTGFLISAAAYKCFH